jgi:adenylyl-sulfate kinase
MTNNIHKQSYTVSAIDRSEQKQQRPLLIWITGLSGSGKSTIANNLDIELNRQGFHTYILDGDNIRKGINNNLGFSPEDRKENLRRVAEISKLMLNAGLVIIGAFIAPYEDDRKMIRNIVGTNNYFEIFIDTPLEVCEKRDIKGLYAKARRGEIKDFTGITAPYERPTCADIVVKTENTSMEQIVHLICKAIQEHIKLKDD